ncbi:hypothetical protein L4C34_13005 [Vibrio profundum]|uniref:hypothetical protein n=1 Tax=Vibrio profundum TaxID=2910247 RepID=UPI003D1514E3
MTELLVTLLKNLELPKALLSLYHFDLEVAKTHFYSGGFELLSDGDQGLKLAYSDNEEFLCSIIEFAQADFTGSSYAFWLTKDDKDLSLVPIVVLGSEGEAHIVAKNLNELLQILSLDCEPLLSFDEVCYYIGEDDEPSHKSYEYREWLEKELHLKSITSDEGDLIVERARQEYQTEFEGWMNKFIE